MANINGFSIGATSYPITDGSFQSNRNLLSEKAMGVAGEPALYGGTYTLGGSISAVFRPSLFNTIINGILGTSGTGLGDSFTIYDSFKMSDVNGKLYEFGSCTLSDCTISLKAGAIGTITFTWVGIYTKSITTGTITAPSYTATMPLFYNIIFTAAGTAVKCKSVDLKITRPIAADDFCLGSEYTQSLIQSDSATISGSITLGNASYNLLSTAFITGDEAILPSTSDGTRKNDASAGELILTMHTPDGTAENCEITLASVYVSDGSASVSGRQPWSKTVNFRAVTTATTGIVITYGS